jgi:hypothetical protein
MDCGHPIYPQARDIDVCLKAEQRMLEESLQVSTLAPHIHPPIDARHIAKVVRGVVAVPAVFDAAAFAGSLSLAFGASSVAGAGALLFLVPTAVAPPFEAITFFTHEVPTGHVAVFKSWGITVQNSVPEAAQVNVEAPGPTMGADPPSALLGGSSEEEHQSTFLVIPEKRSLKLQISNLDVGSGILFSFGIMGWQFPINRWDGDLKSLITNGPKGFGLDNCAPDYSGGCP